MLIGSRRWGELLCVHMQDSSGTNRTDEKIAIFTEWMKGDHVFIHLDSRREGVIVPDHLRESAALKLKLSYGFQGETKFDNESVTAYLKFNGDYFGCVVPWNALWGLTNREGESCLWTDELPEELAHLAQVPAMDQATTAERKPPQLSVVEKPMKKKPVLRRIK